MKKIKQSGFSGEHQTTPTKAQAVKEAAVLRHAATLDDHARRFLRRIGVLDSNNELSARYR